MNAITTPRIYVACLASYNAGDLHGVWIDATDADDIHAAIRTMLRASKHPNVTVPCPDCDGADTSQWPSPCATCNGSKSVPSAEEYAIHDYEGFAGLKLSECHDIDEIVALAALIEEHGEGLVEAAGDVTSGTDAGSLEEAIERYRGTYDSKEDYAAEWCEECGLIPRDLNPLIAGNIDWEAVARDMEMGGDVSFVRKGGSVYVFDCA